MNIEQIKKALTTKEYDFLRDDKHLGNNIILLALGGELCLWNQCRRK